jgi:hypothetical protein
MNNILWTKVRKYIYFVLIASIIAGVSFLIVYKVSFLPNGYDIVAMKKDSILLKSFNLLGIKKDIMTASFNPKNTWKIDEINYEVKRQKDFFWLLYFGVSLAILLLFYKVRNGIKLWKAIIESNIIFAILIPLYPIITSLNEIEDLIF